MRIKKSLSQNFLTDEYVLKKIEQSIPDLSDYSVCEIGPGRGALTEIIIKKKPKKITLIEKDDNLQDYLRNRFDLLNVINEDILRAQLNCDIVIASIPYSISRDIVKKIIIENISQAYLIVQKEFAEKLYEDKKIAISVFTKTFYEVKMIMEIKAKSFYPIPKVDSYFIHLIKKDKIDISKMEYWEWLNRIMSQKKRILKNVLNINDNRRLIQLTYEEIKDLYVNSNIHSHR